MHHATESYNQVVSRLTREVNFLHSAASEDAATFRRSLHAKDEQIQQLQSQIQNLKLQNLQLNEKQQVLERDYDRLRLRLETQPDLSPQTHRSVSKPSNESKLKAKITHLEDQLSIFSQKLSESDEAAKVSAAEAERSVQELQRFAKNIIQLRDELNTKDVEYREQVEYLKGELRKKSNDDLIKTLNLEISVLKEELTRKELDFKRTIADLKQQYEETIQNKSREVEKLQELPHLLEEKTNKYSQLSHDLKNSNEKCFLLEQQLSELRNEKLNLEKELTSANKFHQERLQKQEIQFSEEKKKLEKEIELLKEKEFSLKQNQENLISTAVKSLDQEKDSILSELDQKTEEVYAIQQQKRDLECQISKLSDSLNDCHLELDAYRRQGESIRKELLDSQSIQIQVEKKAEQFRNEVELIKVELNNSRTENNDLQEEIQRLILEGDELADIRDALTNDLQQCMMLLNNANAEIKELEEERNQFGSAITMSGSRAAQLEKEMEQLRREYELKLSDLQQQHDELSNAYSELELELSRFQS
ncbi:hypothetical protein P9112_009001 [Eukaryota sp. TZLM1-RC]